MTATTPTIASVYRRATFGFFAGGVVPGGVPGAVPVVPLAPVAGWAAVGPGPAVVGGVGGGTGRLTTVGRSDGSVPSSGSTRLPRSSSSPGRQGSVGGPPDVGGFVGGGGLALTSTPSRDEGGAPPGTRARFEAYGSGRSIRGGSAAGTAGSRTGTPNTRFKPPAIPRPKPVPPRTSSGLWAPR